MIKLGKGKNIVKIVLGCACCCLITVSAVWIIIIYALAGAIKNAPNVDVRNFDIFNINTEPTPQPDSNTQPVDPNLHADNL